MLEVGDRVIRKNFENDRSWSYFCTSRGKDPKGVYTISTFLRLSGVDALTFEECGGALFLIEKFLKVK